MSEVNEPSVEFSGLSSVLGLVRDNKPTDFKAVIHNELYSRVNDVLLVTRKEIAANFLNRDES